MSTYDYELVGDRYVAPHVMATVHRVFDVRNHAKTICECHDFDSLMVVVKALNAQHTADAGVQAAQGDIVA